MPGKKKDPNKTYSPNYGGARVHPPGRKGGRPKSDYIGKVVKLPFRDEAEYQAYLLVAPRERVELVLRSENGDQNTK